MQDPIDDPFEFDDLHEEQPTSEVRPLNLGARRLVVDTGLKGEAAQAAWLTVSDEAGAVFFEGVPGDDGCVTVTFTDAPRLGTARIILETPRGHRQAVVQLKDGWTAHAFAG